ncbi:MAG: rRNA maturation RNase YbeY [Patescibacteria group bacterium]
MNSIELIHSQDGEIDYKEIKDIANQTLLSFGINNGLVEINFVSSSEIRILNKNNRDIDRPTDVLSFPQIRLKGAKQVVLGTIVVCPEIVSDKKEDLADVIKHGILHLLGYDHEDDDIEWQKQAMLINCKL